MTRTSVWNALGAIPLTLEYLQVGPWRTRVLQAGKGAPLVLTHGTGGHLETYAHNIAAFAERYRVIAYDFPGHGYSTHATAALELPVYTEHLHGLLDALRLERVHLEGESLGGWVAAKYGAQHPERVASLILNTPGGTMLKPEVMERIRVLSQEAADDPSPERIRKRLEWLMADPQSVSDELVEIRRGIYRRPGYAESMRHILCLQDAQIRRRNLLTDAELAAASAPALVIWTSDDPSGPAAAGMEFAKKMPRARFEVIQNAGHWPQWEQPAAFNSMVLGFLAELT
jgi:2-hydroxy-6-oxonona-2,4-dienedioate hydrolase